MAEEKRSRTECPICGGPPVAPMLDLTFAEKINLPSVVTLNRCIACDFAYTAPADPAAYDRYYAQVNNDLVHDALSAARAARWITIQSGVFQELLSVTAPCEVLDYGCGGGDLLRALALQYPQHRYTGFDIHLATTRQEQVGNSIFTTTLGKDKKYDLIILSHVAEHLADFDRLYAILNLLNVGGTLYVEVPNALEYVRYPRREFLYYIDRLHVNHFSLQALTALAKRCGLSITRYGQLALPYKDGADYPSHYIFCHRAAHSDALAAYIAAEQNRPSPLAAFDPMTPLLVYGFGDHFFRSHAPGGPLDGRKIVGVIDQCWEELQHSEAGLSYKFMSLDDAMQHFPNTPLAIAVSWGAESIAETIRAKHSVAQIIIL